MNETLVNLDDFLNSRCQSNKSMFFNGVFGFKTKSTFKSQIGAMIFWTLIFGIMAFLIVWSKTGFNKADFGDKILGQLANNGWAIFLIAAIPLVSYCGFWGLKALGCLHGPTSSHWDRGEIGCKVFFKQQVLNRETFFGFFTWGGWSKSSSRSKISKWILLVLFAGAAFVVTYFTTDSETLAQGVSGVSDWNWSYMGLTACALIFFPFIRSRRTENLFSVACSNVHPANGNVGYDPAAEYINYETWSAGNRAHWDMSAQVLSQQAGASPAYPGPPAGGMVLALPRQHANPSGPPPAYSDYSDSRGGADVPFIPTTASTGSLFDAEEPGAATTSQLSSNNNVGVEEFLVGRPGDRRRMASKMQTLHKLMQTIDEEQGNQQA